MKSLPWKAARGRLGSLASPTAHLPKDGTARIPPTCLFSMPECVCRKGWAPWIGTRLPISHSAWAVFGGGWVGGWVGERVPECGMK